MGFPLLRLGRATFVVATTGLGVSQLKQSTDPLASSRGPNYLQYGHKRTRQRYHFCPPSILSFHSHFSQPLAQLLFPFRPWLFFPQSPASVPPAWQPFSPGSSPLEPHPYIIRVERRAATLTFATPVAVN